MLHWNQPENALQIQTTQLENTAKNNKQKQFCFLYFFKLLGHTRHICELMIHLFWCISFPFPSWRANHSHQQLALHFIARFPGDFGPNVFVVTTDGS